MKPKMSREQKIFLAVLALIVIYGLSTLRSNSPSRSTAAAPPKEIKVDIEKEGKRIQGEIDGMIKNKEFAVMTYMTASVGYRQYVEIIDKLETSEKKELRSQGKSIRGRLTKLQVAEYPLFRQRYVDEVKHKFWRENIEIFVTGKKKNVLNLTGAVFANNANKEDFQKSILDQLVKLRFKRVNYRWFKYDDEYTYYTINSFDDDYVGGY